MATITDSLDSLFRLSKEVRIGLQRLGIETLRDLLFHFPARYADSSRYISISNLTEGADVTIRGVIKKIAAKKSFTSRVPMTEAVVEDVSGTVKVIWFNQPYLAKMHPVGSSIELTGRVSAHKGMLSVINPSSKEERALAIDSHDTLFGGIDTGDVLTPIYPETKGVSSEWLRHAVARVFKALPQIDEYLPSEILSRYSLPSLRTALVWIHTPHTKEDALKARKRFSFDEIFSLNVSRQKERSLLSRMQAYAIDPSSVDLASFQKKLGFPLTGAQKQAVQHISADLERDAPMSRLLEGDVGSGKTAVAALAAYLTVMNRPFAKGTKDKQAFGNLQVAYMAPTEILATQQFESFIELFKGTGIQIALLTGSGARKFPTKIASSQTLWTPISKTQLRKWIANGEIPIVIGTHTLIQKSLEFKHLALVIIDEQHRFGLSQRKGLAKKDSHFPHLLSMTATPIPRTLALTVYGDLDLSVLDELPNGRRQVITEFVSDAKREAMYDSVRAALKEGRQAYVICPRIDEPDPTKQSALQATSVEAEAARLAKDVFPTYRIGTLHSKMTKQKKDDAMTAFAVHKTDILVATSVVEVGVNVPNATVIIIEGAERFGLSQLHQLRGRVQRSSHQSYCYLFAEAKSDKTRERMKLFAAAKNGFELAEYDLQLRGTGELTGARQWGVSDIGMEALRNPKLVEAAREAARALITADPDLTAYPLLAARIAATDVHGE
ncbi:ATP-dependent DNA helicase RecG [Candidatus Nomurabacteria bacterium]|nr:ATP-dependent DNA helicase RecG [Candidatus Nomurabacteria bacterium]